MFFVEDKYIINDITYRKVVITSFKQKGKEFSSLHGIYICLIACFVQLFYTHAHNLNQIYLFDFLTGFN